MIAVDATGSDSRPVALNSRRFRAAPTARQVAPAQGRAACPPTLAHARVGLHGSSVRMPTIATYCIYSTKRTYHPASAGGRHSTGSRRREYFSGVILFSAPRRTKTPLRSTRADAFPARCGSWQVHSISPPARRRPMRRSIRCELQHARRAIVVTTIPPIRSERARTYYGVLGKRGVELKGHSTTCAVPINRSAVLLLLLLVSIQAFVDV